MLAHETPATRDHEFVYHLQQRSNRPQLVRCAATWGEVVDLLTHFDERDHKDGPGYVLAEFSDAYRKADNVTSYHGICLDIDTTADADGAVIAPPPPVAAFRKLEASGLAGVIYTTHNHQAAPSINGDKPAGPRYRIVIPVAVPIEPKNMRRAVEAAARIIGLRSQWVDSASWSVGQMFYLPSCRPRAERFAQVVDGRAFHPDDMREPPAAPPAAPPQAAPVIPFSGPSDSGFDATKARARGQWRGILSSLGIGVPDSPRMHSVCPGCGGKDRFRFDDRDGAGTFICTQGTGQPLSGDGFALVQHARNVDAATALRMVRGVMGLSVRDDSQRQQRRPEPAQRPEPPIDMDTGEILDAPFPANDNDNDREQSGGEAYDIACVDWYSPFPDANGKGKPLSTIENVREACRRLGVNVRYNVIAKEIEILIPGEGFSIDNQANASLAWLTSACARFGVPTGQLGDFLCYLADRNQYNPVAQWVLSKPWDGQSRLQALFNTIKAEGEDEELRLGDLKEAMIRRWLISAVAGAFEPEGVSAHGVLVLQGDQYLGKTKWFKSLVPRELGVIQDGLMLRPDDRDSVKQCVSYWLVELGELDATFRKSDIAQLKSFLTRDRDTLRRAYAKLESHYARRTVFFASVNPRQFLHDPTGNRRYWTISCASISHDHNIDMQQLWAEVYEAHYKAGESWYLSPEEFAALNEHNKDHEVIDPIRERLLTKLDWQAPRTSWRWATATDVMVELGFDRPNRGDVTQCGQFITEMNGGERKKSNGKQLARVPPKVTLI